MVNSVALEGDGCHICSEAEAELIEISRKLNCSRKVGEPLKAQELLLWHLLGPGEAVAALCVLSLSQLPLPFLPLRECWLCRVN